MSSAAEDGARERFQSLVARALAELPDWVREHLETVTVVIEDEPPRELLEELGLDPESDTLFGLYDGVPIGERSLQGDESGTPSLDTIRIFRLPLEDEFLDLDELAEQVRITVVHEVGHHLGLDEDDLDEHGFG